MDVLRIRYSAPLASNNLDNLSYVIKQVATIAPVPVIPSYVDATQTTDVPNSSNILFTFHNYYKHAHGYLAVVVCCVGILANLLNIMVLTRRTMLSATNVILTGLAISDTLTMAAYLPFAIHFYCIYGTSSSPERNTLHAARYMLFFASFSVLVHTVSIWLTVILAVSRFMYTKFPLYARTFCTVHWARRLVCVAVIISMCLCLPNLTVLTIIRHDKTSTNTSQQVMVWVIGIKSETEVQLFICQMNFWVQAVFVKLLPSVTLSLLSLLILRAIRAADHRRQSLRNLSSSDAKCNCRRSYRTTRLLLTVVVLFVLTEFPQGILHLLSGILPNFFGQVYDPLGDFLDILVLINSAINLLLYCSMSSKFRQTFVLVIVDNVFIKLIKQFLVHRIN